MQRWLIIATNQQIAKSLKRHLAVTQHLEPDQMNCRPVRYRLTPGEEISEFQRLTAWIEGQVEKKDETNSTRNLVVFTDVWTLGEASFDQLNPLSVAGEPWAKVLGLLVLAFPEVLWVCAGCGDVAKTDWLFERAHLMGDSSPMTMAKDGLVPLFDPCGFRNAIRRLIKDDLQTRDEAPDVPVRTLNAFAIDEEKSYAFFHAYIAFRFGFCCHVVTSHGMMQSLFAASALDFAIPCMIFEDLYLPFPDANIMLGYSNLQTRDANCPKLAKASHRIIVTTGHGRKVDRQRLMTNRNYLASLRQQGQWNKILFKPLSGIFNLWEMAGLNRRLGQGPLRGLADGFVWPPTPRDHSDDRSVHSAPGRLLEVANCLIDRAERLLANVRNAADAVHGAVLATEALELLGNRTPTTALEALSLKHQFEVLAECQFYGVQSTLHVKSRLMDLQKEVRSLAYWFAPRARKFSEWNAEAIILNKLIKIFRDHNRLDEEHQALVRSRALYRKMWFHKNRWATLFHPVAWYVEFLLGSLPRFMGAIVLWVGVLTLLYHFTTEIVTKDTETYVSAFVQAIGSFFSIQPPPEGLTGLKSFVVALGVIGGFVHLGIFISHLYSVISRK